MVTLLLVFSALLGLACGSFANVLIFRLPRDLSIVRPPSHCPSCDKEIKWYRNIPVLSFVILGGRCADCKARISPRYPLVELLVGVLFWFAAYNFARRLKRLRGLTPYEFICKAWADQPQRFTQNPHHQMPGLNI